MSRGTWTNTATRRYNCSVFCSLAMSSAAIVAQQAMSIVYLQAHRCNVKDAGDIWPTDQPMPCNWMSSSHSSKRCVANGVPGSQQVARITVQRAVCCRVMHQGNDCLRTKTHISVLPLM
jgi:hypothetical protein